MIGETVGNFTIVSQLGKGGMGEVWLAQQRDVGTRVAIKVLRAEISEDEQQVRRFFNEARATNKIQHPGIVQIFDAGHHTDGRAYLVMELLEGERLSARIDRLERLPMAMIVELGRQIASILDATHGAMVIHRDLKPDNIYLVPDGEVAGGERVKILDFGIAKLISNTTQMTATSVSGMGTPLYMAPEQWRSLANVDWRADAYSLGCVLFEMACGRPPFDVPSMAEACQMHLMEPPPVPSTLVPGLPPAFDALIAALLAKEPQERPTMARVAASLADLGRGPGHQSTMLGVGVTRATEAAKPPVSPVATTLGAQPPVSPVATTLGASATSIDTPPARPRRRGLAIGAVIFAGAAGAGALAYTMRSRGETPAAPPPGDAAVAVSAPPPDAAAPAPDADALPSLVVRGTALARISGVLPELIEELTVKLCIDDGGAVTFVDVPDDVAPDVSTDVKTKLEAWRFGPYRSQGSAVAACAYVALPAREVVAAGSGSAVVVATNPPRPPVVSPPRPPSTSAGSGSGSGSARPPEPAQGSAGSGSQGTGSGSGSGSGSAGSSTPPTPPKPGSGSGPGKLELGQVEPVLARIRLQLGACGGRGKARTKITIAPSGVVTSVNVEAGDAKINACVEGVLRKQIFPTSPLGNSFLLRLDLGDRRPPPGRPGSSTSGSAPKTGSA